MAFVHPYGKNIKNVKYFIHKIVDELLKRISKQIVQSFIILVINMQLIV